MRIYATIFAISLGMLLFVLWIGYHFLPGYVGSDNFWQSVLLEGLSFVVTVAAVGSLTAAVMHIINEREITPLRQYASKQGLFFAASAFGIYHHILKFGIPEEDSFDRDVVRSKSKALLKFRRKDPEEALIAIDRMRDDVDALVSHNQRFATIFPASCQSDLINIERYLLDLVKSLAWIEATIINKQKSTITFSRATLAQALGNFFSDITSQEGSERVQIEFNVEKDPSLDFYNQPIGTGRREEWLDVLASVERAWGAYVPDFKEIFCNMQKWTEPFSLDRGIVQNIPFLLRGTNLSLFYLDKQYMQSRLPDEVLLEIVPDDEARVIAVIADDDPLLATFDDGILNLETYLARAEVAGTTLDLTTLLTRYGETNFAYGQHRAPGQ